MISEFLAEWFAGEGILLSTGGVGGSYLFNHILSHYHYQSISMGCCDSMFSWLVRYVTLLYYYIMRAVVMSCSVGYITLRYT